MDEFFDVIFWLLAELKLSIQRIYGVNWETVYRVRKGQKQLWVTTNETRVGRHEISSESMKVNWTYPHTNPTPRTTLKALAGTSGIRENKEGRKCLVSRS